MVNQSQHARTRSSNNLICESEDKALDRMAQSQVIRMKIGKTTFEVLAKPGNAMKYRGGKLGYDKVLLTDEVFTDANKGKKASLAELKKALPDHLKGRLAAGTEIKSMPDAARIIVDHGDIALTTAERQEAARARRAALVEHIHKYFIDPKSKRPHPAARIETALDNIKLRIDGDTPLERLVADALKKLPDVLPLKKVTMGGTLTVPHALVSQVQASVSKMVTIDRQTYDADGCTMCVSMCPGDLDGLLRALERIGKGAIQMEVNMQDA